MTDAEAIAALHDGADALGVPLASAQLDQLLIYLKLIERWGAVYNLTAVRDRPGIVRQHLLDSLAVLPALHRHVAAGSAPKLLDVGSGAGLPGLVIAIAEPTWPVTCVDAVGKKVGFMRQVAAELGLTRAEARHGRVEALPSGLWTLVISRAFASLEDFAALSEKALAPHGSWVAMKAKLTPTETAELRTARVFHVEQLQVPGLDAERRLVWMKRPGAEDGP